MARPAASASVIAQAARFVARQGDQAHMLRVSCR